MGRKDLKNLITQRENKDTSLPVVKKLVLPKPFGDWRDIAIRWLNRCIYTGWFHKRPALYIHGTPNSGKSVFVKHVLLQGIKRENIFTPVKTRSSDGQRFAWSHFDPYRHVVVYVDEFDVNQFDMNVLKEVLEGADSNTDRKGVESAWFHIRVPFIICAQRSLNDQVEDSDQPESNFIGLKERLFELFAYETNMDIEYLQRLCGGTDKPVVRKYTSPEDFVFSNSDQEGIRIFRVF